MRLLPQPASTPQIGLGRWNPPTFSGGKSQALEAEISSLRNAEVGNGQRVKVLQEWELFRASRAVAVDLQRKFSANMMSLPP